MDTLLFSQVWPLNISKLFARTWIVQKCLGWIYFPEFLVIAFGFINFDKFHQAFDLWANLLLSSSEISLASEDKHNLTSDMEFVKKITPPDFQVKDFTPSISPNFNSVSGKKHKNEWKWINLLRWQKFYTAAGTDGMDKFHLSG